MLAALAGGTVIRRRTGVGFWWGGSTQHDSFFLRLSYPLSGLLQVNEALMRMATNVPRKSLISMGVCIGKFTHSRKFHLHVTALPYLGQYAQYKVWVKSSAELSFLYGNHVLKAGLGRITENTPAHQGVVIYSMTDIPLGFGVTARSTLDMRSADPQSIVVLHQADVGEYLRDEQSLT